MASHLISGGALWKMPYSVTPEEQAKTTKQRVECQQGLKVVSASHDSDHSMCQADLGTSAHRIGPAAVVLQRAPVSRRIVREVDVVYLAQHRRRISRELRWHTASI